MKFYGVDVTDMESHEIDDLFKEHDESHLWPIENKFNATKKAIKEIHKDVDAHIISDGGIEYACALDQKIAEIVNNQI